MLISIDWSHTEKKLAIFDGQKILKCPPKPSRFLVIVTENMPGRHAKPFIEGGATIKHCSPNSTAEFRDELGWEKTDENDAKLIYKLYQEKPELFREYVLPSPEKACFMVFRGIQKNRKEMEQRLWHLGTDDPDLSEIVSLLEKAENKADKLMRRNCESEPIFKWLTSIRGIGGRLAATLIALTGDVARFPNIGRFYSYAGLAVRNGGIQKKKAGEVARWNHKLKSVILNDVVGCLMRAKNSLYYEKIYKEEKEKQLQSGKVSNRLHAEKRARRKMAKIFFEHYFSAYRESKGLPVPKPWIIEFGGHTDYIEPLRSIKEFL